VGGNDSLIFDGCSLYVNGDGLLQCAQRFVEEGMLVDLTTSKKVLKLDVNDLRDLYQALVLGIRDYFRKVGFSNACLGLSGGVDSAVVACLAVEALGAEHVSVINMPSRYSAPESKRDAERLARKLGIEFREISIESPFEAFLHLLAPTFIETQADITEENLQARIRGMLLMAFSNKFGALVLNTSNKSELALGYSTLYGDMCGGLAVIGDVSKGKVYDLARWINREEEVIPWHTLQRPPSAELRPNQKDSDALPDYAVIDNVLQAYVEEHRSPGWIAKNHSYPLEFVESMIKKIHLSEYKRRQAPPCLRVSEKAFSVGRRFPIVQRWI
jgi:NAD+ synthase (glutamine-hydrolysing)